MKATTERRLAIREFISWKRHTSIPELMKEFAVSKSTILRDLDALAETTSYYSTTGLNGGIHAMDDWHASKQYLSREDEAFVRMVIEERLSSKEEKERMERIFAAYVRPRKCS